MEAKDLFKDEVEKKKEEESELAQRKEDYKDTQRYLLHDKFLDIENKFIDKGEKILPKIKKEIKERKECKSIYSEVDKIQGEMEYYNEIINKVNNDVFKRELKGRTKRAESNMYIKVSIEDMFDFPVYTKLDFMKMQRNRYSTVRKMLTNISETFFDNREENEEENPYNEAN